MFVRKSFSKAETRGPEARAAWRSIRNLVVNPGALEHLIAVVTGVGDAAAVCKYA